jgi:hypothetical protein
MFFSNGIYHFFPTYLDIAGVVFQVSFNCKYGKHINTCEITFLVCVPIVTVLISFKVVASNGLVFSSLIQVWLFLSSSFCVVSLLSQP